MKVQSVPNARGNESFYLAINKKELNRRYFLSAYLKQAYPGTVAAGAAGSLGTRVVTFREQNGKLFVFDAQDGRASSDTFDPSLIIEAYPVVDDYEPFLGLSGHDDYVLFDPAAGLNRFGVVSDLWASNTKSPLHFQVDLSYLQNFRTINDGATFEQVFTGAFDDTLEADRRVPENWYTGSGTLGIALRRYTEGENFRPVSATGFSHEFYFTATPLLEKNTGKKVTHATKWNIHPGMKPIKWVISDQVLVAAKEHPKYDIVGAIKAGIENWNAVFGFKVLEAVVGTPRDSFADDDTNYFVYDADPTYGFAFADWRLNPNTGEIRGASVYFKGGLAAVGHRPVRSAARVGGPRGGTRCASPPRGAADHMGRAPAKALVHALGARVDLGRERGSRGGRTAGGGWSAPSGEVHYARCGARGWAHARPSAQLQGLALAAAAGKLRDGLCG
ncbi:hypothetical protein LVJ94_00660 [Pendulispora rubella]|uniref:Uncharacterized protein n=2 Tax=Pendulispora rubella TaxID=2741070 RepID=A0ABZ2L891_9BACT